MFEVGQWVRIKTLEEMGVVESEEDITIDGVYISTEMKNSGGAYAKISSRNEIIGTTVYCLEAMKGSVVGYPGWNYPEKMLEPAFKKGTRVRIKSWKQMESEFGVTLGGSIECRFMFALAMRHLCGRYATIERVTSTKRIYLENWSDTEGDLIWSYSTDMIEPVSFLTVSVDFDGTITQSSDPTSPGFNSISPSCKEVMEALNKIGVRFYLLTARSTYLQEALNKCEEWKLPIYTLNPREKKMTDFYIDDKDVSCRGVDWKEIYSFFYSIQEKRLGKDFLKKVEFMAKNS